ncbi:MAG: ribulokinase [Bacteroidota bacterium]
MSAENCVIGLDYGSDSVRAILVDTRSGKTIASHVHWYRRWKRGLYCDPSKNQFRQHTRDHLEGMEEVIGAVVRRSGLAKNAIKGIGIDTTGSSPVPVDRNGVALCELPEFTDNPNAMVILWKDHTAVKDANEINELARHWGGVDFTKYSGGVYSAEWFWAKILKIYRDDVSVKHSAYSWMEHCDYMTYVLTGRNGLDDFKRSRCAAGHKAMWHEDWEGLPSADFLRQLDPALANLRSRLYSATYTSDSAAGIIDTGWADHLGLSKDVVISVGVFDAHAGAVGAEVRERTLVRVMGTSTCDIMVSSPEQVDGKLIKGICGQVNGSVIPGMVGLEAGQSGFGDVLAWFRDVLAWPLQMPSLGMTAEEIERAKDELMTTLSAKAAQKPIAENSPVALDWINGRRTPNADQNLRAALMNIGIGTGAPELFRALVEAISFGSKAIVERFKREGIAIDSVVGIGGVAKKSEFVMQTLASVLNIPIKVAVSEQAPALGAAMYASVASGIHPNLPTAIKTMGNGFERTYHPKSSDVKPYEKLYEKYQSLGAFVERQTTLMSKYQKIKQACYDANMELPKLGLVVYTFGNVSAVDRHQKAFAIKPSGVPYEALSVDDMVVLDFDNQVLEGEMRPSSDTKTHAYLYKTWKNIGGIAHTHATYSVAWAQAQLDIPILGTTHADHLTTNIPCAAPMSDELISGNYEHMTGQQILDCFKQNNLNYQEVEMVLIGNHGPFTWGVNAAKAVYNSRVLEELAKMAYLTLQINPAAPRLQDSLIAKHYERKHGKNAYYGQSK